LYYAPSLNGAGRALATPPLAERTFLASASQQVHWNNEGRQIEGLLNLPTATSGQRVPLVMIIHGGPTGAFQDGYYAMVNFLVGQGWAVLRPNPRGSTGRGADFAAANKNDLGGADYRDIMTGLDAVLKQYPIDPDRLALFGYSYGGEMAGFVEGKTNRFKAIISGAPVIDQFSEYGTENDSWYDRWFFGKPWEHFEDAWKQSPLAGVAHATTPFLLLQGKCIAHCGRWACRWSWWSIRERIMGRWRWGCLACRVWSLGTALMLGSEWCSLLRRGLGRSSSNFLLSF
jgi:dipeptidyl aminopeptidase/acylaminoacyl peptidase